VEGQLIPFTARENIILFFLKQPGVPTVSGQKTTLSRCGIGLSQRAKAFAMEFPFDVKAVLPIGIDVRVARRRQMHHIAVIDVITFGSQLILQALVLTAI